MKKKVKIIQICNSESPDLKDVTLSGDGCWGKAQAMLNLAASRAPSDLMGCYKTEVIVVWEDGETYKSRLTIKNALNGLSDHNLADHIRHFCIFHSGLAFARNDWRNLFSHLSPEQYTNIASQFSQELKDNCVKILDEYEIGESVQVS